LKGSTRQGEFISDKIRHAPNITGAMDDNSGGCKGSEGMRNKDNGGAAGTKELNILPTKSNAFIFDIGISTASVFLFNEVGELATKYQYWHKLTANENQSAGRPASHITTGCAHIYLVKMRNKIRDSLKAEIGPVHRESRQGRPGMAKDLDPRNKTTSLQRIQAGSTVMKALRSASSGFSLTPESKPSAAAVEAEKHTPKVAGKEKEYGDQGQGQGDGKEGYDSSKQLPDARNHKDEFQDQLRASTLEAMPKKIPSATSHPTYSDFFLNLHDGDEFATDVVKMGGPVERPIEIHTSAIVLEFFFTIVLDFFFTHAYFSVSLQDAMSIILKRSQDETFSAPTEWATFIKQGEAQGTIEEAMVEFAADTTLEVRRKTRLDDVVSLLAPRVEVQTDETWMLPERGQMTSTAGSHVKIEICRGAHAIDYALLDGKSGTEVLQKHPHPTINSRGGQEGWVSLGASIEAGKQLECASLHDFSYEPGCDAPCVDARTKSYSDKNAEELAQTATETQRDPSKGAEDEETARTFKLKCHHKELDQCSIDTKQLIARDTFNTKTGSYEGFSEQHVPEVMEKVPSHKDKTPMEETRQPQDQLGITGPEAMAKTGSQGLPFQSHKIQDAPEAMDEFSSREHLQEQMTFPKEAKGKSQDSEYSTVPEAMVKFGQTSPPSQALAISLFTQDARTQDAPEAMVKFYCQEQLQEHFY
jgi:hypothetical protein